MAATEGTAATEDSQLPQIRFWEQERISSPWPIRAAELEVEWPELVMAARATPEGSVFPSLEILVSRMALDSLEQVAMAEFML